jgi:hypothetical protein
MANVVRDELVWDGIAPAVITIGVGKAQFLKYTAEGVRELLNRRVEIDATGRRSGAGDGSVGDQQLAGRQAVRSPTSGEAQCPAQAFGSDGHSDAVVSFGDESKPTRHGFRADATADTTFSGLL